MIRIRLSLSIALAVALCSVAGAADPAAINRTPALRRPASTSPSEAVPDRPAARRVQTAEQLTLPKLRTRAVPEPDNGKPSPAEVRTSDARQDIPSLLKALNASEPHDVSASGRYVVAADAEGGLTLIDAKTRRRLRQLEHSVHPYQLIRISRDARWIAGVRADDPSQIDLWRADNGQRVRTIAGEPGDKTSLEFEDNELQVSSSSGNGLTYSVPAGELVGGFQSANGRAGVAPRKAAPQKVTIGPRPMVPEGSDSGLAGPTAKGPQHNSVRAQPAPSATIRPPAADAVVAAPPEPAMQPQAAAPMAAAPPAEAMAAPMAAAPMAAAPMAAEPQAARSMPEAAAPRMARSAPPSAAPYDAPAPEAAPQVDGMRSFMFSANDSQPAGGAPDAAPQTAAADNARQPTPAEVAALAAKPQAQPPAEQDLSSITVHYATNRNRLTETDRQWQSYFRGFFFSLPAVVGYVVILLALLVFPWLGKRGWAAASVVSGVFLLCSMAAFEAYVRSHLRDELSGELYGSAPTALHYGTCTISVPKPENRSPGELNRPVSVWVFEAPENPDKHFVLKKVDEHDNKDEFYESLSSQLARSEDGTSLLFIHGYNVSFEDAIFRTAQLAVDLKFRGAPISFSWPSYADPVKYTFDEQNAEVSVPALAEFLEDLSTRSGAKRIHIIAHSMGNRVLAGALRSMSPEARTKNKAMFREIVLAAPDIDSRVFQTQVLPHIQDSTQHCTLYASSRDRALMLSRYFHNYQRLGETLPQLVVTPGMDTIDASMVDTSLLGHSYIGDVQSIVSDLRELVIDGKRPTERVWLQSSPLGELMYWAIKPQVQTASEAESSRK